MTHPLNKKTGCKIHRKILIPENKKTTLALVVGHYPKGDWDLIVKANGKELLRTPVSKDSAKDGWLETEVDLSEYAGKRINLELVNQPTGWAFEAGYWAKIDIVTEQSSHEFVTVHTPYKQIIGGAPNGGFPLFSTSSRPNLPLP